MEGRKSSLLLAATYPKGMEGRRSPLLLAATYPKGMEGRRSPLLLVATYPKSKGVLRREFQFLRKKPEVRVGK